MGEEIVSHVGNYSEITDYRRWRDRIFLDELAKAHARGEASDSQGGYYYPMGKAEGSLDYFGSGGASAAFSLGLHQFQVRTDLLNVVKSMRKRKDVALI